MLPENMIAGIDRGTDKETKYTQIITPNLLPQHQQMKHEATSSMIQWRVTGRTCQRPRALKRKKTSNFSMLAQSLFPSHIYPEAPISLQNKRQTNPNHQSPTTISTHSSYLPIVTQYPPAHHGCLLVASEFSVHNVLHLPKVSKSATP